jgi:hypothetical protein
MKAIAVMSEAELAAYVQQHLLKRGIRVVLSGGTCVTIFSKSAYVSGDLDLVAEVYARPKEVAAALAEIGFERQGRVYKHPESGLLVDIMSPPLAVGGEPVKQVWELQLPTGTLRMLSPTDCVKDRLANYYYFNDRQGLEQACLVVAFVEVDLAEVGRWSVQEGQEAKFADIRQRLCEAESARRHR